MIQVYLMALSILAAVEWPFTESLFCDHEKQSFLCKFQYMDVSLSCLMLITSLLVLEQLSQKSQPRQNLSF